jgi:hypothetical protein
MSVYHEVRAALMAQDMDVLELMKFCPSAKEHRKLNNVLAQLCFTGRIRRAGSRIYTVSRHSKRTKAHEIRQKYVIWRIADWPGEASAPAENLPNWISPSGAPEVKGSVRTIDNGMHRG